MAADDQEKTEEPTPKKIQKARSEGNVPKSAEVAALVSLVVAFTMLFSMFWYVTSGIIELYQYYMTLTQVELTKSLMIHIAMVTAYKTALLILPIAGALMLAGVIANVSQFGFLLSSKVFKFKFDKIINPLPGIKGLFALKKLLDAAMVTVKVFVAFIVGAVVYYYFFTDVKELILLDFKQQLLWFKEKALILILWLLFVFFIISAIDLVIKRYQYFKQLKMSKQEVKDERKQQEGNPEVKAKILKKMYEMAGKRMMSSVPSADVVVTNPTHYAVALRYDQTKDFAPVVVAKGVDTVALKIKEIAREHYIQIVENPPLARELYRSVEIDQAVPEQLYQAVAELFAYIHKTQKSNMSMR